MLRTACPRTTYVQRRELVSRVTDRTAPEVTIADGLAAMRLEHAIKRSVAEQRPVEVA